MRPIGGNMKKQRMKAVALSTVISAGALLAGVAQADQNLKGILSVGQAKVDAARASQVRINKLQDQTAELISQFKVVNKQIDGLRVYNQQLEKQLDAQRAAHPQALRAPPRQDVDRALHLPDVPRHGQRVLD